MVSLFQVYGLSLQQELVITMVLPTIRAVHGDTHGTPLMVIRTASIRRGIL